MIFHQITPGIVDSRHYLDKAKTVSAWFPGRPMGLRGWVRALLAGRVQAMVSIGPHWHWRLSKVRLKHLLVCGIVYARAAACDHRASSLWSEVSEDAGLNFGPRVCRP